nr:hypothetical protein [Tanacetum cinerariifolium]
MSNAQADCQNSTSPSCEVYESCFAKYCNCKQREDEYFETYGAKYCKAFLGNINFSDAGTKWRDSTLRCLQESIVPRLDLEHPDACNCKAIKDFAYESHQRQWTARNPDGSAISWQLGQCGISANTISSLATGDGARSSDSEALAPRKLSSIGPP